MNSEKSALGSARSFAGSVLIVLLALAAAPCAFADADPSAEEAESTDGALTNVDPEISSALMNRLQRTWWVRKASVLRGNREEAERQGRILLELMQAHRVHRVPPLAEAALLEAQHERELSNPARAFEAYELARALDPQLAAAYWGEATLRLRTGASKLEALKLIGGAMRARLRTVWGPYASAVRLAGLAGAALLLTGALAVLMLVVRHGGRLAHSIGGRVHVRVAPAWRSAIGWAVVLSPLAVVVLGAWAIIVWCVLLGGALSRDERFSVAGWLILLAAAVPMSSVLAVLETAGTSPTALTATAASEGVLRADTVPDLVRLSSEQPDEALWRAMLAQRVEDASLEHANRLFRQAYELDPSDPRILIGWGNLLHRAGKFEGAAERYRQALELAPEDVRALFNLAKAEYAAQDFQAGDEYARRARELDVDEVLAYEADYVSAEDVVDPVFGPTDARRRVLAREVTPRLVESVRIWNPVTLAAIAALLGLFVTGSRRDPLRAEICSACGSIFDVVVDEQVVVEPVCSACRQVLGGIEGLSPAARQEQAKRISRHTRRTTWGRALVNLVWPGLGQIHEGRTLVGLALCWGWSLVLVAMLAGASAVPGAPMPDAGPGRVLPILLAAVVWLIAQVPGVRPARVAVPRE